MKVPACVGCGIELYSWVPALTKGGKPYICRWCAYSGKRAGQLSPGAQDLKDELERRAEDYLMRREQADRC